MRRLLALCGFLGVVAAPLAAASARDGRFAGARGAELGYRIHENDAARGALVLVNGFTETYLMYDELARPLVEAGYRVYTYDHRGQGVSDRLLPQIDVGYVEAFSDYVEDLDTFIREVVRPLEPGPLDLVAHSTGGLIAVHYEAAHPGALRKLVLSAPFFELNSRWAPGWLAKVLVTLSCAVGRCDRFAPSQGNFTPDTYQFETNHLTHSKERFDLMRDFVWKNQALLIRGASSGFLRETIQAGERVPMLAAGVKIPVLLLQAGIDDYVLPGRQDLFCKRTRCEKVRFEEGYHELFFEHEAVRSKVLDATLRFLKDEPAAQL